MHQKVISDLKYTFYIKFMYIFYELERLNLEYLEYKLLAPRGVFVVLKKGSLCFYLDSNFLLYIGTHF